MSVGVSLNLLLAVIAEILFLVRSTASVLECLRLTCLPFTQIDAECESRGRLSISIQVANHNMEEAQPVANVPRKKTHSGTVMDVSFNPKPYKDPLTSTPSR